MPNKINIKGMSLEEWRELRRSSIGASDSGPILGLLPESFGHTNVDAYLSKVGEDDGFEGNLNTELGLELEPFVMKKFNEATGLTACRDNFMRYHSHIPYISANLDGLVRGENVPLEIKIMGEWTGEIPPYYYTQLQHQMLVHGSPYIYYAALVLGWRRQVVVQRYERDDDLIYKMLIEYDKFWNAHVVPRIPPMANSLADAGKLYPYDNGDVIEATAQAEELARICYSMQQQEKQDKANVAYYKGMLGEFMKPFSVIEANGVPIVTWKRTKDGVTFDKERFRAENPKLYEKYLIKKEGSRRMLIKKPIESQDD